MPLSRFESGTSGKRWVSMANWATPVGYRIGKCKKNNPIESIVSLIYKMKVISYKIII
ncbi:hypothetical protein Hanom_Chr03g00210261 [Helianthus anomalus]